jgi:hypothetical protein
MNQWDERFSGEEYVYGIQPNAFLEEQLPLLEPGTILFACEGEGRNAVFAASLGWNVSAFDGSIEVSRLTIASVMPRRLLIPRNHSIASHSSMRISRQIFAPEFIKKRLDG